VLFVGSTSASIASRPASVTIASRPSVGRDGAGSRFDLGQARRNIFLQLGLDSHPGDLLVGLLAAFCIAGLAAAKLALPFSHGMTMARRVNVLPRAFSLDLAHSILRASSGSMIGMPSRIG
jgi:hypothetical protein